MRKQVITGELEHKYCCLVAQSCLTRCNPMDCIMPGFLALHHLPDLAQAHVHWTTGAIQPSGPLLSPLLLLSIFASIRVFFNGLSLHTRWPKYWCFRFNISPSNDYSGLISFKTDCFDHIAVQGTLSSFLHHHSSKASILGCSAFFRARLSHLYMTPGKTTVLTKWTFVSKVMSLLVNTLSRFVITFLPRRKCLLISWWQSLSTVIFESKKIKSAPISMFSLSVCHEVMGPDLRLLNAEF